MHQIHCMVKLPGLLEIAKSNINQLYLDQISNHWYKLLNLHGIELVNNDLIIINQNKLLFLILCLRNT